ncbi:MAG: glycoside hydrolase family 97 protein [Tannerella sp.]|jgi:alpha-glucosidase|nr:glycoside hydrolase family 97 protein [Tannerella sp.]
MKQTKLTILIATCAIGSCLSLWGQDNDVALRSPDGKLDITFRTIETPVRPNVPNRDNNPDIPPLTKLVYEVNFNGKQLLEPSAMGLELENNRYLGENVMIAKASFSEGEDNYTLLHGRTKAVSEKYNAVLLEVAERTGRRKMHVEARAYNDAVAFRYVVPEQTALIDYRLKNEKTEYRLPKDATAYALMLPNHRSGYESEFLKIPVSGLSNQGGVASYFLIGMPLVLDVAGVGWMAITETDLEGNSATYLRNPTGSWAGHWFETVVSPSWRDSEVAVTGSLPHKTAWRVIIAASDPARFIETNAMTGLNPESRISDTSWITTGKSSWDWWNGSLNRDGERAYTTETMKYYVDFAAESGFEFMTIDAGWSGSDITVCRDNVNVPEVVKYAREKGVKVIIWLGGTNVWNQMDRAFPLYEEWGVAGMKIDFILRDDQAGIDFYYRVAEKAAKHKLLVDFHGATKPWGLQRTYPNVIGYECVLGMENSLVGVRDNPENRLIYPFTRMIAGLMDFTPGAFDNATRDEFVARNRKPMAMGTRAHHLAIYVVYESPFQMVSDWPENYRNQPADFKFIRDVPVTWDKTIALNGRPGEYVTVARKKGDDWFLGAMTNWTPRNCEISLDFLESGNYEAEIYADAPDADKYPEKTSLKTVRVKAGDRMKASMAPGGGLAVRFRKMK